MQNTYQLTPAERATAQSQKQEIDRQTQTLIFFLAHLVRAAELPEIAGGYTLSPDNTALVPAHPQGAE